MIFELPSNTLPRLEAMIANATDTNGSAPLTVAFEVRHADGGELSAEEADEIRAVLAGYSADGPLDGVDDPGSKL